MEALKTRGMSSQEIETSSLSLTDLTSSGFSGWEERFPCESESERDGAKSLEFWDDVKSVTAGGQS